MEMAGGAILGILEAIRAVNEIEKPGALGTERAAVYRMIRVAFEVNDLRLGVLCLIAKDVHDDAATNGAIRACVAWTFCKVSSRILLILI